MTNAQLKTLLDTTGFPVAYRYFATAQQAPYICFFFYGDNVFSADSERYHVANKYRVELYTAEKDPSAESRVENALAGFVFSKDEDYIESIKMLRTTYEIEV